MSPLEIIPLIKLILYLIPTFSINLIKFSSPFNLINLFSESEIKLVIFQKRELLPSFNFLKGVIIEFILIISSPIIKSPIFKFFLCAPAVPIFIILFGCIFNIAFVVEIELFISPT